MGDALKTHKLRIGTKASRALLATILSLLLAFGLVPVGQSIETTGLQPSVAFAEETQASSLQQRLAAIDGVTSVTPIEQIALADGSLPFKEKYLITIEQPIDWNNPGLGTFQQRVEVGYQGDTNINVFETGGYCLPDIVYPGYLGIDDRNEICRTYNANLIEFEYRFFGASTPAGLSNTSTNLWEYLTVENAAQDFHAVIGKIGQVLSGKRVFTGASKGGYTTNVQAYLYPNDADAFVSYVAPLCDGTQDRRFYQNVYETIGDSGMSAQQAQECRDLISQFQVECINHRTTFVENNRQLARENEYTFNVDDDIVFDVQVLEFATGEWQYYQDFSSIRTILAEEEGDQKLKDMYALLQQISPLDSYANETPYFPYYIQSELQMGNYYFDFSYLRTALDAAYQDAKAKDPSVKKSEYELKVTSDMESNLMETMMFTPAQRIIWHYSDDMHNELIDWSQTTTTHSVMIYGGTDPWYAVRIPDVSNPSVHRYVAPTMNHGVRMTDLTAAEQTELSALLDSWLIDYNVSFNMNGVGAAPAAQVVGRGLAATKPDNPTDSGYTFEGWYTDAKCTVAYDFATPVTADITLYAKWTAVAPEPQPDPEPQPKPQPQVQSASATQSAGTATTLVNTSDDTALPVAMIVCMMLSVCCVGMSSARRR